MILYEADTLKTTLDRKSHISKEEHFKTATTYEEKSGELQERTLYVRSSWVGWGWRKTNTFDDLTNREYLQEPRMIDFKERDHFHKAY